ncbi:hypothetical protein SGFS_008470 [Streptomyces graminofaciens]|uniref:Uncharacterized protein n=1 Tax=Streptomyces graminofaciens TaxID=68212 RepID=A0ABM7F1C8_9ACTN|nr:hypothetical protein SGFS_008470 [Streptomyces graminofaciens]
MTFCDWYRSAAGHNMGQGPGEHLKGRAVGGEVVGERGEPFPLEQVAIAHGRLARGVYSRQARAPCHACRDGPIPNPPDAVRDPARLYISRLTAVDGR